MSELAGDLGTRGMDRLGEPRQAGGRLVVDDDDFLVRTPFRRDGQIGDRRQADTAAGRSQVVVDQLIGDQTVRRTSLERGRLDGPVAELDRTQGGGFEDVVHEMSVARCWWGRPKSWLSACARLNTR